MNPQQITSQIGQWIVDPTFKKLKSGRPFMGYVIAITSTGNPRITLFGGLSGPTFMVEAQNAQPLHFLYPAILEHFLVPWNPNHPDYWGAYGDNGK